MYRKPEVVQVAFLNLLVDGLDNAGVPTSQFMRQSGLDRFRLTNPHDFVPLAAVSAFYDAVAQAETGEELPTNLVVNHRVMDMGDWGDLVYSGLSLYEVIQIACDPQSRNMSFENLKLRLEGNSAVLSEELRLRTGMTRDWIESTTLYMMIDGLRNVLGKNWRPIEIRTSATHLAWLEDDPSLAGVRVAYEQKCGALVFPASLLATPFAAIGDPDSSAATASRFDATAAGAIIYTLESSNDDFIPTIASLASVLGVSVRTLQRRLEDEGMDFSTIIDRWRFKRALQLLSDSNLTVREVSELCRYSHSAQFIRAFRRWTNASPTEYRES